MLLANFLYTIKNMPDEQPPRTLLHAMPLLLLGAAVSLPLPIAITAPFLAAKVLALLIDANVTPAHRFSDGQNYHQPTSGCCSAIISLPVPELGLSSVQCSPSSTATCRGCCGW